MMPKEIPFGIKYSKILNLIVMIVCCIILLFLWIGPTPKIVEILQLTKGGPEAEKLHKLFWPTAVSITLVSLVYIFLLIWINKGLAQFKNKTRIAQIIIACLSLLTLFPIGTIFYLISLYYMLFDAKTKEVFQKTL